MSFDRNKMILIGGEGASVRQYLYLNDNADDVTTSKYFTDMNMNVGDQIAVCSGTAYKDRQNFHVTSRTNLDNTVAKSDTVVDDLSLTTLDVSGVSNFGGSASISATGALSGVTTLETSGDWTNTGTNFSFSNSGVAKPSFTFTNTNADDNGVYFNFVKDSPSAANGDDMVSKHYKADTTTVSGFSYITETYEVVNMTNGSETGRVKWQIRDAGALSTPLTLEGADVTIGGKVEVSGDIYTNSGLIRCQTRATNPTAQTGGIYFNTTSNTFLGYNGSSWVTLG